MEILDIVDDNGIPTGKTDCAQKVWKYRTSPAETMHGEGFLSGLL